MSTTFVKLLVNYYGRKIVSHSVLVHLAGNSSHLLNQVCVGTNYTYIHVHVNNKGMRSNNVCCLRQNDTNLSSIYM